MKLFLIALALAATAASAQPTPQSPYDAERERRAVERDRRVHGHERYPRWCRGYDQRDYWIERRACEFDRQCRARVNRKAERCGLR